MVSTLPRLQYELERTVNSFLSLLGSLFDIVAAWCRCMRGAVGGTVPTMYCVWEIRNSSCVVQRVVESVLYLVVLLHVCIVHTVRMRCIGKYLQSSMLM